MSAAEISKLLNLTSIKDHRCVPFCVLLIFHKPNGFVLPFELCSGVSHLDSPPVAKTKRARGVRLLALERQFNMK